MDSTYFGNGSPLNIMQEPKEACAPKYQQVLVSQGRGPPLQMPLVHQVLLPASQQSNFVPTEPNIMPEVPWVNVKWIKVPQRQTERPGSHIPSPRHGHRAVTINNTILVFGGGNEGIFTELMAFDTVLQEWFRPTVKGKLPEGRAAFGMIVHEKQRKILIFGGMLEYTRFTNSMYELDLKTWTWKELLPAGCPADYFPSARIGHSFTLIGDVIYAFGGLSNHSEDPEKFFPEYLNDLPTFHMNTNPPNGLWADQTTFGSRPSPRESHSAVAYSSKDARYNKIIIFGGMSGSRLGDLHVLDVDTFMWSRMDNTPYGAIPRSLHSSCLVGERMYVFGGWVDRDRWEMQSGTTNNFNENYQEWAVSNDLTCLNVETMSWEKVQYSINGYPSNLAFPRARAGHCATVLNNRIYMWSGRDGYNKINFDAKDSGLLQVCCGDMWYLDVGKPAAPTKLRMLNWCPTKNTLRISWDPVPGADSYILQCQKKEETLKKS